MHKVIFAFVEIIKETFYAYFWPLKSILFNNALSVEDNVNLLSRLS